MYDIRGLILTSQQSWIPGREKTQPQTHTHTHTHTQTDRQTDRQTDPLRLSQTHGRTQIHTQTHSYLHNHIVRRIYLHSAHTFTLKDTHDIPHLIFTTSSRPFPGELIVYIIHHFRDASWNNLNLNNSCCMCIFAHWGLYVPLCLWARWLRGCGEYRLKDSNVWDHTIYGVWSVREKKQ